MQYLFSKSHLPFTVNAGAPLPYSMNPFLEESGLCAFRNKVLHLLEFLYAPGLKSLRVVKDKAWVTSEGHLIPNAVDSALGTRELNHWQPEDPRRQLALTPTDSWICARST